MLSMSDLAAGAWGSLTDDPATVLKRMAEGAASGAFSLPTETPTPVAMTVPQPSPNNGAASVPLANQQPTSEPWYRKHSRLLMIGGGVLVGIVLLGSFLRPRRK